MSKKKEIEWSQAAQDLTTKLLVDLSKENPDATDATSLLATCLSGLTDALLAVCSAQTSMEITSWIFADAVNRLGDRDITLTPPDVADLQEPKVYVLHPQSDTKH